MKKYMLLLLLLTASSITFGQKMEITTNGLFLNSKQITKLTTPKALENILGKPDRKYLNSNTIWTYDKLGLNIYINTASTTIVEIDLEFKKKNFEFSPLNNFSSNFIVYGFHINENTPIIALKTISELSFKVDDPNVQIMNDALNVYIGNDQKLQLIFMYSKDNKKIETLSISFR